MCNRNKLNSLNILDLMGDFTWCFNQYFFVETEEGNFVWSSSDYGGNNTLTKTKKSLSKFLREQQIEFGRDKGKHIIKNYCGNAVKILVKVK